MSHSALGFCGLLLGVTHDLADSMQYFNMRIYNDIDDDIINNGSNMNIINTTTLSNDPYIVIFSQQHQFSIIQVQK